MRFPERGVVTPVGIVVLAIVVLGAGALILLASGGGDSVNEEGDTTLERIRREGVVRVAYANEEPYGYLDTETGEVTGEAPEIAREILSRLGVEKMEPVVTEFGSLIPGLKAGQWDLVAAGMYITPERAKQIAFSNPTYVISETFVVRDGNPKDLHGYGDVAEDDSAKIGVMGGSVEHGYAKKLGVPEDRIVVFPDYPSALTGLRKGRVDAIGCTYLTGKDQLSKSGEDEFELAEPFADPVIDGDVKKGYGAFGFRKQDESLVRAFNRELEKFLGTEEHLELVEPFGFGEGTLPGDVTAEEIISGGE